MKNWIKRAISGVLLILIVILFIMYIINHLSVFSTLRLVNPWLILILIVITLINSTLLGMVTDALVSVFGIRLKFKEWFGLSVITTFYNTLMPFRGGMMARAAYLKEKHGFPYTTFLAALAGTYVIDFLVASFLGLISLILLFHETGMFNSIVLVIFLIFFIPLSIIVIFSPKISESNNELINKFVRVLNGWNLIRKNRRVIFTSFTRATLYILISSIGTLISYSVFGLQISFAQALFLTSIGFFGILISITPAGLGIQQVIAVFSALVINIGPEKSLPVSLLSTAILMIVVFTLGPIFSIILIKHKVNKK